MILFNVQSVRKVDPYASVFSVWEVLSELANNLFFSIVLGDL